jgi:hypothetical protein
MGINLHLIVAEFAKTTVPVVSNDQKPQELMETKHQQLQY